MIKPREIFPLLLAALLLSQLGCSQKPEQQSMAPHSPPPAWMDPAWRESQYPPGQSYASFLQGDAKKGANAAESLEELKRSARYEMATQIIVDIKRSHSDTTEIRLRQLVGEGLISKSETIDRKTVQTGRDSTDVKVANAKAESYYDPQTRKMYAFAAVSKSDVADFYSSRIDIQLSFADREFAIAEQEARQGQKEQAHNRILAIEDSLKNVKSYGLILQTAGGNYISNYAEAEKDLGIKASSLKMRLEPCLAKLHWNPEKENAYSGIAFEKLSRNIKIEKSPCKGRGISLIYKGMGHKCEHAGIYGCQQQPSLAIASCDGAQRQSLAGAAVKGFHRSKKELAEADLQKKLKEESFWNEWEQKIKQWSPQCEQ